MDNQFPKPVTVSVERADVRNGKIIIVLNPDLLSGQEFAVNPYYNEGTEKNKLQLTRFAVSLVEQGGKIKECKASYTGYHSTTGHSQVHNIGKMFINRFDKCLDEILTLDIKYLKDSDRMQKIFDHYEWTDDQKSVLKSAINERFRNDREDRLAKATAELIEAQNKLQSIVSESF